MTITVTADGPMLIRNETAIVSTLSDRSISFKQLKVSIFNPFSGAIVNFSIVVSPSFHLKPTNPVPFYSQSAGTTKPYIAILTSSVYPTKRAKRGEPADFSGLCDTPSSNSSCDVTIGKTDSCPDNQICNGNLKADTVYYIYLLACNDFNCTAGPTATGQTGLDSFFYSMLQYVSNNPHSIRKGTNIVNY